MFATKTTLIAIGAAAGIGAAAFAGAATYHSPGHGKRVAAAHETSGNVSSGGAAPHDALLAARSASTGVSKVSVDSSGRTLTLTYARHDGCTMYKPHYRISGSRVTVWVAKEAMPAGSYCPEWQAPVGRGILDTTKLTLPTTLADRHVYDKVTGHRLAVAITPDRSKIALNRVSVASNDRTITLTRDGRISGCDRIRPGYRYVAGKVVVWLASTPPARDAACPDWMRYGAQNVRLTLPRPVGHRPIYDAASGHRMVRA